MQEIEYIIALVCCAPLVLAGFILLVNSFYEVVQVGKGYVRAELFSLNRRAGYRWVKPTKDRKFVIDDKAYDFNDGPDYMVLFGTALTSVPTIYVDSIHHKQKRIFAPETDEPTINPAALDGVNKLSFKTGYLEGLGAAMNTKMWFLIAYILIIASIAAPHVLK